MPSSSQFIYEVLEHQKTDLLIHLLLTEADLPSLLVILRTKEALHSVTAALSQAGLPFQSLHGTKKPELRDRALRDFKEDRLRALVATEAVARASDLDGIRHILQFDFYEVAADYLLRLDTVRQSQGSIATFVTTKEKNLLKKLEDLAAEELPRIESESFAYAASGTAPKTKKAKKNVSKPLQHKKPKLRNGGRDNKKSKRTKKR